MMVGNKGEEVWDWLSKRVGMETETGGVLLLQDTRLSQAELEKQYNQWWRERGGVDYERTVAPVKWALAPSPEVQIEAGSQKGLKPMGGTLVLVWGDVARHAGGGRTMTKDRYGRWAALEVQGAEDNVTVYVSAYRPPGGDGNTKGAGGLVARMAKLRGWKGTKVGTRAHQVFYKELGEQITKWREEGKEVVIGGDFNEEEPDIRQWGAAHDLVMCHEELLKERRDRVTGRTEYTYVNNGRGGDRRLDHILVTERIWSEAIKEGGWMKTEAVAGHVADHLAVTLGGINYTEWLGGRA